MFTEDLFRYNIFNRIQFQGPGSMAENIFEEENKSYSIGKIAEFIDESTFNKIINKLTDYAEIISEGKLAGMINFNYRLSSIQTNRIIELLIGNQAISKIYNIAMKGARDLEEEYISNIFSDNKNPAALSSYVNLRNLLENRLSHQIQQYNINMNKNNNTMAMPLNELKGHVRTYEELTRNNIAVSSKAQHGIIAASLHDSYVILLNNDNYRTDRTYIKYFFNEDDLHNKSKLILSREPRLPLTKIHDRLGGIIDSIIDARSRPSVTQSEMAKKSA